jgi:hypothetical protein
MAQLVVISEFHSLNEDGTVAKHLVHVRVCVIAYGSLMLFTRTVKCRSPNMCISVHLETATPLSRVDHAREYKVLARVD